MPELITRREGPVGWVILSNPAKFNAMSMDMWAALPGALAQLDGDPEVRVIALAGDGDKAFVSGADISQFEKNRSSAEARARYDEVVHAAYRAPMECGKPVLAKIRGICMGGGLGLASSCDLRIAADDAVFRMPAARLGLGYNFEGVRRFVDLIGPTNAADVFFSARKFDAADALRMGFVNRVVPAAELDRETTVYCETIAENAPLSLAAAKRSILEARRDAQARDTERLQRMIEACFTSEDYREGRAAFAQKRRPAFKGS